MYTHDIIVVAMPLEKLCILIFANMCGFVKIAKIASHKNLFVCSVLSEW